MRDRNSQPRPHSDNEIEKSYKFGPKPKARIREFVPDSLRHETRQIMKQLEINKPQNLDLHSDKQSKSNLCSAKTHVHICHCQPIPGRPGDCPFCFADQNYNFANMQTSYQRKPKVETSFSNKRNQFDCVSGQKSKVIYKPSGSTVVIEKHLGK